MAQEVFGNVNMTTINATVSTTPAAGTSEAWTVVDSTQFKSISGIQQFRITVGPYTDTHPEIVMCTAINSGTSIQVSRGAEGSLIKTHAIGDPLCNTITAGVLTAISPPTGTVEMFAGINLPGGWLNCDGTAYNRTTYGDLFATNTVTSTCTTNGTTTISAIPTIVWNLLQAGWYCSGTNITGGTTTITPTTSGSATLSGGATGSTVGGAIVFSPFPLGDGSTTFNVPDFRSRVPVGMGQGSGLTNRILGANGGEEANAHTHGSAAHNHTLSANGQAQYTSSGSGTGVWLNRVSTASYTPNIAANVTSAAGTVAAQNLGVALAGTTDSGTPGATGSPTDTSNMMPFQVVSFIIKI